MPLEPATLTNLDTGTVIQALFNPNEYRLSKDNNFARMTVPGLSSPLLQFVSGNLQTLDMELVFDSLEEHRQGSRVVTPARADVRQLTQPVVDLMAINPETHAPPLVLFAWGSLSFTGVVARVGQRFTMFLDDGTPVRARLDVGFQEFRTAAEEAREVKRQTADYTRLHVAGEGQSVSDVAAMVYNDPARWRPLAIANDVEDLRRLPTGARLVVPPLPFRDPTTGEVHS